MANVNAPYGFRQYRGNGSAPTYEQVSVNINYNAGAIYFCDPVTQQADGSYAQSASTGASPAALGIGGIFVGCKYLSVAQKRTVWSNYWPGSDVASSNTVTGYIVNDPNAQFIAQTDATGYALADINRPVGFLIGTGNTANGLSGAFLSTSTISASFTANAPFKVVGIYQEPPTAPGTLGNGQPYDYAIVAFNNVTTRNLQGV